MNNEQIKEELLKAKEAFIKSTKSEENDLRKENLEIIEGIKTNQPLHERLLEDETFLSNKHTINYLEKEFLKK